MYKESEIKKYIEEKEWTEWYSKIIDAVSSLTWKEKENEEWPKLFNWLKNDKNLLKYAELTMKGENLNRGEKFQVALLEVKLSITCSYFPDFKIFLKELQAWTNTSWNNETVETYINWWNTEWKEWEWSWIKQFCGIPVTQIQSLPYERSSSTWVTWCSKTARENWKNFWLNLPFWDAYNAGINAGNNSLTTIPSEKKSLKPQAKREWIAAEKIKSEWKWNYADIYTDSKSWYWHRAAAFKDDSGQWYVLDPYTRVNWRLDNTPKKLEDYLNVRKIVKAHFYQSNWYVWAKKSS